MILKVICAVVENFHFDISAATEQMSGEKGDGAVSENTVEGGAMGMEGVSSETTNAGDDVEDGDEGATALAAEEREERKGFEPCNAQLSRAILKSIQHKMIPKLKRVLDHSFSSPFPLYPCFFELHVYECYIYIYIYTSEISFLLCSM
tara:strand:- start:81 stop:524 length:444 start_codon:yes stop_codon:yes gene_type:complete